MAEDTNLNTQGRVRPTVIAGNGDTAFVDYHDLHPANEMSATIGGAAVGAVGGGVLGALPGMLKQDAERAAGKLSFKGKGLIALGAAAGAAVGGVVSWLNARTHNQWSQRVTAATLDKKSNQTER